MKQLSLILVYLTAGLLCEPTHADDSPLPQRVLYIGRSTDVQRTEDFTQFLQRHFTGVRVFAGDKFDPRSAEDSDVVLLDWSQQEMRLDKAMCPLGEFGSWTKPTVLLGSAGLLVASQWQLIGGAG